MPCKVTHFRHRRLLPRGGRKVELFEREREVGGRPCSLFASLALLEEGEVEEGAVKIV